MPENPKQEVAYLRIEKPPEGWTPPTTIWFYLESAAKYMRIEVLGPPVPALPDALSPEARAVLDMAAVDHSVSRWAAVCKAYRISLAPHDPLREAREALAEAQEWAVSNGTMSKILARLSAALDRLDEKGGAP